MYPFCKDRAFTLLELVITIAVLAIITSIALPSFHSFRENQEVSQLLPSIRQYVNFSKSVASTQHTQIVMCSSSNSDQCDNSQWEKGIIIFSDLNNNKKRDATETIYKKVLTEIKYGTLTWSGGATNLNTITFQSDSGLPRGSPGSFYYCSFKHPQNHRYIPVSPMGHTRIEDTTKC